MILDATAPHTRVDNFVIDEYMDKIGAVGLGIYTVIKRHYNWATGQCTPSYKRIAQMCKVSRRTVIRYVKRFKEVGLIDPHMRFTDEGQTSNQYAFYQPERPKPAQKSTPAQMSKPPVTQVSPPPVTQPAPDQVDLNKKEKKEIAKSMPIEEKKEEKTQDTQILLPSNHATEKTIASKQPVPTRKQKACPHPYAEVVTFGGGITICNHCFDLISFLPDTSAA